MSEVPEPQPPHRWYQFSLARMFLLTTLVSVLVAAWSGLVRFQGSMPIGFYVMTIAAPLAVVIVLSLLHALGRLLDHRR
ncbi:MAG: hypothetical protein ABFD16_09985 [Thermoguttaceae bacterium]|jgi:hypothetical protein